jgi:hypothetical protein
MTTGQKAIAAFTLRLQKLNMIQLVKLFKRLSRAVHRVNVANPDVETPLSIADLDTVQTWRACLAELQYRRNNTSKVVSGQVVDWESEPELE